MDKKKLSKNTLSLTKLDCSIKDFSKEILDIAGRNNSDNLFKKFVQKFLHYVPIDYQSNDKAKFLFEFSENAYQFFKKRSKDDKLDALDNKIEIVHSKYYQDHAMTLMILADNKPFAVDSINAILKRYDLEAKFIFHPVIYAKRDENGSLLDIAQKGDPSAHKESLIYMKILKLGDDDIIHALKKEIRDILTLIDTTYAAWQPLLENFIHVTNNVQHKHNIYDKYSSSAIESIEFLTWLQKNNFTFLGMVKFKLKNAKSFEFQGVSEIINNEDDELRAIIKHSEGELYNNKAILLGKLNKTSLIHRSTLIDYILVKDYDEKGNYIGGVIVLGLYGSALFYDSIMNVPILRGKYNHVVEEADFSPNGYFAKKLKNIVESLPREILIQIAEKDLYCMSMHILSSMATAKMKLFMIEEWSKSLINVLIFLPRKRLTTEAHKQVKKYLISKFNCNIITDSVKIIGDDFALIYITLSLPKNNDIDIDLQNIREEINKMTIDWSESLIDKLSISESEFANLKLLKEVEYAFPSNYRFKYNADEALTDIRNLIEASQNSKAIYQLKTLENDEYIYLKIYQINNQLNLSDILPSIENLGFIAIEQQSFAIKPFFNNVEKSWIYEFQLRSPNQISNFDLLKSNVEQALQKIDEKKFEANNLTKLIVLADFNWKQVKLIKALCMYLHQTGFTYGKSYVIATLIKHYAFTKNLFNLFDIKFNHELSAKESASYDRLEDEMKIYLENVASSAEDKVLKYLLSIVQAMLRTNFYQLKNGEIKDYISFKINSKAIPELPLPLPYTEIFVYSNEFEGVHLRGGKVSRGGLRWSDRGEDYRTEVLSLMKAQMAKNTVIVPEGSKGTFYVKLEQGQLGRDEYMKVVIKCYKQFLCGLLDLTDNYVNNKIISPARTKIYDEQDPYLVVAADKGTASFSDFANEVSKKYNFWLGDAFASGGSAGYDHKKMGITAKGAWISVQTLFAQHGIDVQKEPFTVAGIGDMSGDVFGNGMLLSNQIKLVAAFNHMHIFIDPNPDCITSFKERKRMFKLPRSGWNDYDKSIISNGGGVFERASKKIKLSPEIKQVLEITENELSPEKLIQYILKSNVGLIWNGGIGTYIKSSNENNIEIGDKANDLVRVNGCDVRAKVIGEGGNLGISQLGRIEYALHGGKINTDFIDNSAGVDCSDHEVNIKIALNKAVLDGDMQSSDRDTFLEQMTGEVEQLVLNDNKVQNLAITISELSHLVNIESNSQLIKHLEKSALLDRVVEFLPSNTEIARRLQLCQNLTRPEFAILLSYSKMAVDKELKDASLVREKYFEDLLISYFPPLMQKKFLKQILSHPLRDEIIRTMITNKLVNQLGGAIIDEIRRENGAKMCDIARAHTIVCEIFELDSLWDEINALVNVETQVKVNMLSEVAKTMRRGISWFIRNIKMPVDIAKTTAEYQIQAKQVKATIDNLLIGEARDKYNERQQKYILNGINKKLAANISTLDILVSAFDILYISKSTKVDAKYLANLYFETGDAFHIDWLRKTIETFIDDSYWKRLSIQSLKDDLYDKQRRLIIMIVKSSKNKLELSDWMQKHLSSANIFLDFVDEVKTQEAINLNMLMLATKKFEVFLRKLDK